LEIEEKYKRMIFSILLKKDNLHVMHLGTGFFIGLGGLFFTCGHTFRKIENELKTNGYANLFIAIPSEYAELYKIKSVYYNSFLIYEQKGPEYRDTAVGIVDFANTEFLVFNRKRPKNGEILNAIGIYNKQPTKLHDFKGNYADLSMLKIEPKPLKVIEQEPLISDWEGDYKVSRDQVNPRRFFNNCVAMDDKLEKGESGCPIIDNIGLVKGTFIASSEFDNTSAMILGKYCTKVIKYKTYYQYDTYQDLICRKNFSAQHAV
jgi:hypothetical protein